MTIDQAREFVRRNVCVTLFVGRECVIRIGDERHEQPASVHSNGIDDLYAAQEAIARLIVRASEEIK